MVISKNIAHSNTHELSKLCLEFYTEVIDWTIKDKQLDQFYKYENMKSMDGPSFTLKNIPFQLKLYPNGHLYNVQNYIQLILTLVSPETLSNIKSLRIYLELFQYETGYQFRRTVNIDAGYLDTDCCKWYRYALALNELQSKEYTELTFGCYVEILCIEYNHI